MPVVIKYFLSFSRSQKYATRSLRSLLSYFYDLSNSRKYFIHHRHNILISSRAPCRGKYIATDGKILPLWYFQTPKFFPKFGNIKNISERKNTPPAALTVLSTILEILILKTLNLCRFVSKSGENFLFLVN